MTARKGSESVPELELEPVPEPEPEPVAQVAVVIDPTVEVNPYSAQPVPQLKPEWDEPDLDPTKRYSIGEDPDGSKNAAVMAAAVARHQDKAT